MSLKVDKIDGEDVYLKLPADFLDEVGMKPPYKTEELEKLMLGVKDYLKDIDKEMKRKIIEGIMERNFEALRKLR